MVVATRLPVPYRDAGLIEEAAEVFRYRYAGEVLPVDPLWLSEAMLDLLLIPVAQLRDCGGPEALLSSDLRHLFLDQQSLTDDSLANRLRFSVSHELAHLFLHADTLREQTWRDESEWRETFMRIPTKEYQRVEVQANLFASYLLVPSGPLREAFQVQWEIASSNPRNTSREACGLAVSRTGRQFAVSTEVVVRRLLQEGLLP